MRWRVWNSGVVERKGRNPGDRGFRISGGTKGDGGATAAEGTEARQRRRGRRRDSGGGEKSMGFVTFSRFHVFTFSIFLSASLCLCGLSLLFAPNADAAFVDRAGVRPLGMGGAFVGAADDVSAGLWNPAGLTQLRQAALIANYSLLHTGVGDDHLGRSYLGYTTPILANGAIGINLIRLQTPLYSETTAALAYSHRFRWLYVGGNIKGLFANFEENAYTELDPFFDAYGHLSSAVSFDLGLLLRLGNSLGVGFAIQNVNSPNLALEEGQEDPLPREIKAGLSAKLSDRIRANLDYTWRDAKIRGNQDVNLHFGLESWFTDEIGIRAGANFYELTAGASYRVQRPNGTVQIDYAFDYPMPFEFSDDYVPAPLKGSTGTHQFALSVAFSTFSQLLGLSHGQASSGAEALKDLSAYELDESRRAYEAALEKDNGNPDTYVRLAQVHAASGEYETAVEYLRQAVNLAPQEAQYHFALAEVYEQYGNSTGKKTWHNKAIIEFEKTQMLDGNYQLRERIEMLSRK